MNEGFSSSFSCKVCLRAGESMRSIFINLKISSWSCMFVDDNITIHLFVHFHSVWESPPFWQKAWSRDPLWPMNCEPCDVPPLGGDSNGCLCHILSFSATINRWSSRWWLHPGSWREGDEHVELADPQKTHKAYWAWTSNKLVFFVSHFGGCSQVPRCLA